MGDYELHHENPFARHERLVAEHRERANEAARLSADALGQIADLERQVAALDDRIVELERERLDRDAWACRVAAAHHPGYAANLVFIGEPYEAIENALRRIVRSRVTDPT